MLEQHAPGRNEKYTHNHGGLKEIPFQEGAENMDTDRIKVRYGQIDAETKEMHTHPEQMTDARLLAELDDIVLILSGATAYEWTTEVSHTEAGRAYQRIRNEIRQRIMGRD